MTLRFGIARTDNTDSRAMNAGVRRDIVVSDFLNSVGGYRHKERRDHLLDILDIDLDWYVSVLLRREHIDISNAE